MRVCFTHTPSRVGGLTLHALGDQLVRMHTDAYAAVVGADASALHSGGEYHWRPDGEAHTHDPASIR